MKGKIVSFYRTLKTGILRTFGANVINKVVSMLSSMILTRMLTQAEYGIWSYVLNIYSYLVLITGFGLIPGALQFGTENHGQGRAYCFFRYCSKNGLLIDCGIIVIGLGVILGFLDLPIENAKPFLIVMMPILLLEFVEQMGEVILRSQNRINQYANVLYVSSILTAVGTCGGAFFGLAGVLTGKYLAIFITILYGIKLLRPDILKIKNAEAIDRKEKRQLWNYSLYIGGSSAMNCLVYSLDITLIAAMIKDATVIGIYRVGTLIPNALQFIPSSVIVSILPNIIYHREDEAWVNRNVKKTYLGLTLVNAFICSVIMALSPLIIRIVSGENYLSSVPVLRVLTLGYFFAGTFRALSINLLAAFRRVQFGLFISITSCFTDIAFNYLFIKSYGMIGAAYATLVVDIITAAISSIYVVVLLKRGKLNEKVI